MTTVSLQYRWTEASPKRHPVCESVHLVVPEAADDGGAGCEGGRAAEYSQLLVHCTGGREPARCSADSNR